MKISVYNESRKVIWRPVYRCCVAILFPVSAMKKCIVGMVILLTLNCFLAYYSEYFVSFDVIDFTPPTTGNCGYISDCRAIWSEPTHMMSVKTLLA
jgi:hypothetical protein